MYALRAIVFGGAGFIGSTLIRVLAEAEWQVEIFDCLGYASGTDNLPHDLSSGRIRLRQGDIRDAQAVANVFAEVRPTVVINLAAETHVDRSIEAGAPFISTNVVGCGVLLDVALSYWRTMDRAEKDKFRFLQVSTDEVFGSIPQGRFDATSAYAPRSPYAASKASADHLVRAWRHTYGLPTIVTHCSNNYGPRQHPEKFVPHSIVSALAGQRITVYGDGRNVRDWLAVEDHAAGLLMALEKGTPQATYMFGGNCELSNIAMVDAICDCLDRLVPPPDRSSYRELVCFVDDRPGHDRRYAVDFVESTQLLGFQPATDFRTGIEKTVQWYLDNPDWVAARVAGGALSRRGSMVV